MEDIYYEDGVPKKRGRPDEGQSAHDDVEMACPSHEEVVAMESPLSDIPSTDFDIEPPNTALPFSSQDVLTEFAQVLSGQALDKGDQQQAYFTPSTHPEAPEAVSPPRTHMGKRHDKPSISVPLDSSTTPTSPTRQEAVEIAAPRSSHKRASLECGQVDAYSVSLDV